MQTFGVSLKICKGISYLRSVEDSLNLWISHGFSGSFFLIFLSIAHVDGILSFSNALFTKIIIRIKFKSRLIRLKRFMIFLQEEVTVSFFMISFKEFRIFFNGNFIIFFCPLELHQLDIHLTNIAVILGNFRIPSDGLFIFLKRLWEFS